MADPTIVLVHGAFADADADYTKCVIEQIEGPVLLVGHSYGGAVITASGTAGNVVGLLYVAAFAPDEGEDLGTLQSNFPALVAGRPSPSSKERPTWCTPPPEHSRAARLTGLRYVWGPGHRRESGGEIPCASAIILYRSNCSDRQF